MPFRTLLRSEEEAPRGRESSTNFSPATCNNARNIPGGVLVAAARGFNRNFTFNAERSGATGFKAKPPKEYCTSVGFRKRPQQPAGAIVASRRAADSCSGKCQERRRPRRA